MILKIFCVYDSAVSTFVTPHFARTHGEAERNFKMAVNDPKSGHLFNSPEQFSLHYVGDYDELTGIIKPLTAPQSVVSAAQCKNDKELRAV